MEVLEGWVGAPLARPRALDAALEVGLASFSITILVGGGGGCLHLGLMHVDLCLSEIGCARGSIARALLFEARVSTQDREG